MLNKIILYLKFSTILFSLWSVAYSTQQMQDVIIFNESEYSITPLPDRYNKRNGQSTDCYRGYVALWELKNDSLILKNIKTKNYKGIKKSRDLAMLYGKGKIVSWYTGKIRIRDYKISGIYGKKKIYQNLVLNITNGICVDKVKPCLSNDVDLYRLGLYFFNTGGFPKALQIFLKILQDYPDYIENGIVYLYVASTLKWLGANNLSENYLNCAKLKLTERKIIQDFIQTTHLINGDKESDSSSLTRLPSDSIYFFKENIDIYDFKKQNIDFLENEMLLFPWKFQVSSVYEFSENVQTDLYFDSDECPAPYEVTFIDDTAYSRYEDLLKLLRKKR